MKPERLDDLIRERGRHNHAHMYPKEARKTSRENSQYRFGSAERRRLRELERHYPDKEAKFGTLSELYKIEAEISRGAFGVVYEACELNSKGCPDPTRKVAIKAIFSTVGDYLITSELCMLRLTGGKNNTVGFRNAHFTNQQYFIVTEYFEHTPFDVTD